MLLDFRVLELLSSKLCHDLISPVSAINNGVELIEDIGGDVVDEAMKLIGDSANLASRRLRLFRVAYGRAGSEANLPLRDMRQVAETYFEKGKIRLSWVDDLNLSEMAEHQGGLKTLINVLILSEESLAYGGEIALHRLDQDDKIGCRVEVLGRNAQMSDAFIAALENKVGVEELTPRTIQPYITGRFADHFGVKIETFSSDADRLELKLSVPPARIP